YLPILPNLKFIAEVNLASAIRSIDWSFDGKYLAVVTAGSVLSVYSYNGTSLTLQATVALARAGEAVRWNPSSYFLATSISTGGGNDFSIYQFVPAGPTLTLTSGLNLAG